jgi:hypothetical protein
MLKKLLLACLINGICLISGASAHYLWVTIDKKAGDNGTTNVYFEGGPSAGDGQYLDPFVKAGKTWIRTVEHLKPKLLKIKEVTNPKQRWLSAALPRGGPRSIDSYGKWGVYRYGQTDVLLHYYARMLDVDTHEDLHELARAEQMKLDIVPHDHEEEMELTILWKGKAVANRTVYIRGPKRFQKNLKTNKMGVVEFKPEGPGRYTFRTSVEENKSGKEGDKEYSLIRHNGTLIMTLPLKK